MPLKVKRHTFFATAGAAFAAGVVRFPAGAAEFSYKFATENPATHHMTIAWVAAAEKIKQDSNGRLEIRVFPNSQLGGQSDMISQVRLGAVEIISAGDFILANLVPVAGITATPFAFATHKDAWTAMDGPLGKYRRSAIAKMGLYPFEKSWDEGYRQMANSVRPIRTPDDLRGLKMRSPDSPVVTAMFKAFGSSPITISSNEMYVSLQTHLCDGIEIPLPAIEARKLYEVAKYGSFTNHILSAYTMIANKAAWEKLPKNLQDVLARNVDGAAVASNDEVVKLDGSMETTLTAQGMSFNHPDIAPFQAVIKRSGLYAQQRDTYGPEAWALLERSVGKLT